MIACFEGVKENCPEETRAQIDQQLEEARSQIQQGCSEEGTVDHVILQTSNFCAFQPSGTQKAMALNFCLHLISAVKLKLKAHFSKSKYPYLWNSIDIDIGGG